MILTVECTGESLTCGAGQHEFTVSLLRGKSDKGHLVVVAAAFIQLTPLDGERPRKIELTEMVPVNHITNRRTI